MTGMQNQMLEVHRAMTHQRAENFLIFEARGRLQTKNGYSALGRFNLTGEPKLTIDLRAGIRPRRQGIPRAGRSEVKQKYRGTSLRP